MSKNDLTSEEVHESLLKCMIGTISTIDLYRLAAHHEETEDLMDLLLYEENVEAHCAMKIYQSDEIH